MDQDPKQLALYLSRARAVLGLAMVALPSLSGSLWLGRGARQPAAKVLTRMVGARDVVLGVGTITALNETDHGPDWLSMAAAADALDAVAAMLGRGVPVRGRIVGLAAAALAGFELSLARQLADAREQALPSIPDEIEPSSGPLARDVGFDRGSVEVGDDFDEPLPA